MSGGSLVGRRPVRPRRSVTGGPVSGRAPERRPGAQRFVVRLGGWRGAARGHDALVDVDGRLTGVILALRDRDPARRRSAEDPAATRRRSCRGVSWAPASHRDCDADTPARSAPSSTTSRCSTRWSGTWRRAARASARSAHVRRARTSRRPDCVPTPATASSPWPVCGCAQAPSGPASASTPSSAPSVRSRPPVPAFTASPTPWSSPRRRSVSCSRLSSLRGRRRAGRARSIVRPRVPWPRYATARPSSIACEHPVLDTRLLSRLVHGTDADHTLEAVAERLGVRIIGRHSALGDALTTAEILVRLLELLNRRGLVTLGATLDALRSSRPDRPGLQLPHPRRDHPRGRGAGRRGPRAR